MRTYLRLITPLGPICAGLTLISWLFFPGQVRSAFVDPSDPALISEAVTYKSGAAEIAAYLSRPKKEGKHPAVIVIHGNSGTGAYVQDVARRLAQ